MNNLSNECFISVDVETSGPIPGIYSLLSIGACLVSDDSKTFECLLKPTSQNADPKALQVSGLDLLQLQINGLEALEAMSQFSDWIRKVSGEQQPIFVGLNAGFDWSFVNYYFHAYLGENPFGFSALDIKALFMGTVGCDWKDSKSSYMAKLLKPSLVGNHNALDDAKFQAELFHLTRRIQNTNFKKE